VVFPWIDLFSTGEGFDSFQLGFGSGSECIGWSFGKSMLLPPFPKLDASEIALREQNIVSILAPHFPFGIVQPRIRIEKAVTGSMQEKLWQLDGEFR